MCDINPLWAAGFMLAFVCFHLYMVRTHFKSELWLVLLACLIGGVGDSLLVLGGHLTFQPTGELGLPLPLWMWGLWAAFGATLRFCMHWLVAQPWRGFVAGAIVGPMVYSGGRTLEIVKIGPPETISFLWIALAWSLILGILAFYINPQPQQQSPQTP